MIKKITDKIPDTTLAIIAAFSMTYAVASSMCLTYPPAAMFLFVILITVVLFVSFYNRITAIAAGMLSGAAFLCLLVYVLFYADHEKLLKFFEDYYYWLYDFIMYPDVPDPLFQLITVIALCLAFSVFSFIFIIKKFKFLIVLATGICIFGVQVSYGITSASVPFYLFLAASLIAYLKHVYLIKNSKGLNEYAKPSTIMLWSIPVSIFIILASSLIHASDKPIQWEWLDQKIISAYNHIQSKFAYESFDYFSLSASSGFGDRSNLLGGRVRLDRTNVLQVTTNKKIYLRGVSKDVYTGTRWINSVEGFSPAGPELARLYDDTEELLFGMKLLSGEQDFLSRYFTENTISVTFLNLKTKSLFIPSKISSINFPSESISLFVNDTGDYSSGKRLTKDFQYTMKAYVPKTWSEEFENILRKSRKGLYADHLNKLLTAISYETAVLTDPGADVVILDGAGFIDTTLIKKLNERSNLIYDKYLQLPDDLPQRIRDLAASLVVSAENDYDKAKAIEKYVAGNFAYNLDVPSTPKNRDFVDYFLFDQQEGYCSYFASAMTILARCVGLPARYVEGYMLPPEPVKDRNNTFIITNMQAHAWPEIYFEGYGWLPFEPTAPFRSTFYSAEIPEQVYWGAGYNPDYEYYMEMMMRYYGQGFTGDALNPDLINEDSDTVVETVFPVFALSVAVLFILLLLFNKIRSKVRLFRLTVMPARESILGHYDYFIRILKLNGLGIEPAETPYQYSARIDKLLFFSPVRFKVITDIFVKARYSRQELTEKEKQLLAEFVPGFLSEIKINMGRLKYFIFKYILGSL